MMIIIFTVTEDETDHGIFRADSPKSSCLCYVRTMSNLETNLTDHLANKYIDVSPDTTRPCIDEEAQRLLHNFKFHKLPNYLGSDNIHSYTVPWRPGGINDTIEEHKKYIDEICDQIFVDVKSLIDQALTERRELKLSAFHTEVLHHAALCLAKVKSYCDRGDDVIDRVREFSLSKNRKPLIVYGWSGSGKTSVIAKVAHCLRKWTNGTGFIVVRFLGTSPQSSTIREVLISICEQICTLYNLTPPSLHEMDAMSVTRYFRDMLMKTLEQCSSETLYLIIDSVDQLAASDGAHSIKWLPLMTPPNVKIIVSLLNEGYNCLECIQSMLPFSSTNYVEVGVMAIEAGVHIMSKWLSDIGRTITHKQISLISEAFLSCPQPLFLKLLFGRARTWKSYTDIQSIRSFPKSTHEALNDFYKILEEYFGKVLVEKALGYLTASKQGISESELEHVLSLDNDVLNDVYQYWDPPMKGVVRIPSLLWKRILHFISDYVVEHLSGGATVMVWYHRQFIESAMDRYVNENTKILLHARLAEFFDGSFANGAGKSVALAHRGLNLVDADRQVPSQPLVFGEGAYNFRKLNELPHHLLHSEQLNKLKTTILCEFEWMITQLKASGYTTLMRDYIAAQQVYKDEADVCTISETLSLSQSVLQANSDMLAGQLLGRMMKISTKSPVLTVIVDDAKSWICTYKKCIFEPLNNCLISPGGELKVTISGHPRVVLGIKKSLSSPILVSHSKTLDGCIFQVWNIKSLECIENISTLTMTCTEVPPGDSFVIAGGFVAAVSASTYMLWNMNTGVPKDQLVSDSSEKFTCIAATKCEQNLLVGTSKGRVLYKTTSQSDTTILETEASILSMNLTLDDCIIVALLENDKIALINNKSRQVTKVLTIVDFNSSSCTMRHMTKRSSGENLLVIGTNGGFVFFVNLHTFNSVKIAAHTKTVKCITHVEVSNMLITGSLDSLLKVWDLNTFSLLRVLKGHVNGIWCVDYVPETSLIVSGSKDDYLKVWDVCNGDCLHTLEGHSSWISSVCAISSDAIVSGSNDKNLKIWKLGKGVNKFDSFTRHLANPECIGLNGDDIAASGGHDALKLWNPQNGKCYLSIDSPISCLLFTSNGALLMSGTKNGKIEVRDCNSKFSLLHSAHVHKDKVTKLLELSTNNQFISASLDSTIIVWTDKLQVYAILQGHSNGITCLSVSNSENAIASSSDGCVCLWDTELFKLVTTLNGHSKNVNCLVFNHDDTKILTGSDDRTLKLWIISDSTSVWSISFSDSIKTINFISEDVFIAGIHIGQKQLKSWNINTGECVHEFNGHTHAVMCMLIADAHHLVTGSRDGTVKLWQSESGLLLASYDFQSQVKHVSVVNLSPNQFLLACTTMTGPIAFLKLYLAC